VVGARIYAITGVASRRAHIFGNGISSLCRLVLGILAARRQAGSRREGDYECNDLLHKQSFSIAIR
jgi:hypothetical protein